jgi:hypothetical protein
MPRQRTEKVSLTLALVAYTTRSPLKEETVTVSQGPTWAIGNVKGLHRRHHPHRRTSCRSKATLNILNKV